MLSQLSYSPTVNSGYRRGWGLSKRGGASRTGPLGGWVLI
jgi:hypothetical protein